LEDRVGCGSRISFGELAQLLATQNQAQIHEFIARYLTTPDGFSGRYLAMLTQDFWQLSALPGPFFHVLAKAFVIETEDGSFKALREFAAQCAKCDRPDSLPIKAALIDALVIVRLVAPDRTCRVFQEFVKWLVQPISNPPTPRPQEFFPFNAFTRCWGDIGFVRMTLPSLSPYFTALHACFLAGSPSQDVLDSLGTLFATLEAYGDPETWREAGKHLLPLLEELFMFFGPLSGAIERPAFLPFILLFLIRHVPANQFFTGLSPGAQLRFLDLLTTLVSPATITAVALAARGPPGAPPGR
jgi:hypothetical protein